MVRLGRGAAVIGVHVEKNPREGICRARAYRALHVGLYNNPAPENYV